MQIACGSEHTIAINGKLNCPSSKLASFSQNFQETISSEGKALG